MNGEQEEKKGLTVEELFGKPKQSTTGATVEELFGKKSTPTEPSQVVPTEPERQTVEEMFGKKKPTFGEVAKESAIKTAKIMLAPIEAQAQAGTGMFGFMADVLVKAGIGSQFIRAKIWKNLFKGKPIEALKEVTPKRVLESIGQATPITQPMVEAMTYQPKTKPGQQISKVIGYPFEKLDEYITTAGQFYYPGNKDAQEGFRWLIYTASMVLGEKGWGALKSRIKAKKMTSPKVIKDMVERAVGEKIEFLKPEKGMEHAGVPTSAEALARLKTIETFVYDTRSKTTRPVIGVEAIDVPTKPFEVKFTRHKTTGKLQLLDKGDGVPTFKPEMLESLRGKLPEVPVKPTEPVSTKWFKKTGDKFTELKDNMMGELEAKYTFRDAITERRSRLNTRIFESEHGLIEATRKLSRAEREALPFIREGMVDASVLAKTKQSHLIKHITKPSERLQKALPEIAKLQDEHWRFMQSRADVFDARHYVENHVGHLWELPKEPMKSQLITYFHENNPYLKPRKVPTLEAGIKFKMKPKTTDIVKMMREEYKYAYETLANTEFIDLLRGGVDESMRPLLVTRAELKAMAKRPNINDYVEMSHGSFGKDKIAYAHPEIAKDLGFILREAKIAEGAIGKIGRVYDKVNSFLKHSQLAISMFHPIALTESAFGFMGIPRTATAHFRAIYRAVLKKNSIIHDPKKWKIAKKAIEHNVKMNPSQDYMVNVIEKSLQGIEAKGAVAKAGVAIPKYMYETFNRYLWDNLHNTYKLFAFEKMSKYAERYLTKRVAKKHGRKPFSQELKYINNEIGQLVNDAFGSQHWDLFRVLRNKDMQKWLQRLMLAPDWAISSARQATLVPRGAYRTLRGARDIVKAEKEFEAKGFGRDPRQRSTSIAEGRANMEYMKGQVLLRAGTHYWGRVIAYNFILLQSLNLALTKKITGKAKFTWQNEPGQKFPYNLVRVFIGKGRVGKNIKEGQNLYARAGKQYTEVIRYFTEPVKTAGGKSAPLFRTAYKQMTGKEVFSNWDTEIARDQTWETRMRVLIGDFIPFAFKAYYTGSGRPPLMTAWPVAVGSSEHMVRTDFEKAFTKHGWREKDTDEQGEKRNKKLIEDLDVIKERAENNEIDWIPLLKTAQAQYFSKTEEGNWRHLKKAKLQLIQIDSVEKKISHIDTLRATGSITEGQAQSLVKDMEERQLAIPLYQQMKQEQGFFEKILSENRQEADFVYRRMRRAYTRVRTEIGVLLRDEKHDLAMGKIKAWNDNFMPEYLDKMVEATERPTGEIQSAKLYRNYIFTSDKIRQLYRSALSRQIYPTAISREEE